ncbi:AraC family transcriptional regulator [Pseudofulvibacter geojedonensis]|uniref:Helix-turn-helix domain-containing protein n=1 Tax=Pseudofulvibacter geojedonensis TaxID=1123758 RepID=A0ABW3I6C1_9FLAO
MAVNELKKLAYKDIFSISEIDFNNSCLINKTEQINTYTIFWIKNGKGTYNVDFKNYSFEGNTILFLTPGEIFSIGSEDIQQAFKLTFIKDFYCIETHDKAIACNGILFNNIYETPFIKPCKKDSAKLSFIIDSIIDELSQESTAQYDMLQSYLKQFIIHAVRIKKEHHIIKDDSGSRLFKDFSLLVEQNFKQLHSITDYANRLGVSPKSLSKHFQKLGTTTPSAFLKNRIILEAKRELFYTNKTVKEIAFYLGFNDPAYFTRFFTKATKKSPLQFKKEL